MNDIEDAWRRNTGLPLSVSDRMRPDLAAVGPVRRQRTSPAAAQRTPMEAAELEVNPHSVANRTHAAAPVVGLSGALVNCLNNLEARMARTTMRFRTKAKDLAHMLESSDSIDAAASQRSEFGFGGSTIDLFCF